MTCLKCGRQTDQTFCERCRETMEKYPVKPGAFVFIPREHKQTPRRAPARLSSAKLERQIAGQKKVMRRLSIAVVILLLLLLGVCSFTFHLLREHHTRPVGQNYSTVVTTEEPETASEDETGDPMFHVKR